MSILRNQQIEEILDAENKIRRQVIDLTNRQVKQFNEEIKEKNTTQIASDINIDTSVDKLLQILETKYNAGETFLMSSFSYDNSNQKLLTQLLSNQDIITLYNKIVNLLNSSTLEETNKEALKLKILQLKPLIDSLSFIIFSIIRVLDDPNEHPRNGEGGFGVNVGRATYIQKFLPRIFTGYSLIRVIQKQLERNTYQPITIEEINTEFNRFIDDYRADYGAGFIDNPDIQTILNESIKNKSLQDAEKKRIKQMEQELGGQPLSPEELQRISNLYLKTPIISSNLSDAELKAIADSIYGIGEQLRVDRERRIMAGLPPEDIPDEIPLQEQEVRGQITERSAMEAKKEITKITDTILKSFGDRFKKVFFPNTGAWNLATARIREQGILEITKDIMKYYLSSQNKAPVDDATVETENNNLLQSYTEIWSRIIDKTNNDALNAGARTALRTELTQIKSDYKDLAIEANKMNEANFMEQFVTAREGENTNQGEPFIFTGQGKPFLYNDENNE